VDTTPATPSGPCPECVVRKTEGSPTQDEVLTGRDDTTRPRILIVGKGFDQTSGVGITLASLFRGWPKGRLAAACSARDAVDTDVCRKYYFLGSDEFSWRWPLSRFEKPVPSGPFVPGPAREDASPSAGGRGASSIAPVLSFARRAFWAGVMGSGGEHYLRDHRLSPGLATWIGEFRPDVLYTHLESLPMIHFVDDLITSFRLPLVIHMMDDWPSVPESEGLLAPLTRRLIDRDLRRLMDKAAVNMAISRYMGEAFQSRYGHPFLAFHNVLDKSSWTVGGRKTWRASTPFRLVYTGRIGKANKAALHDVAVIVASLAAAGAAIRLEIYALEGEPARPGTWPQSDAVRLLPPVAYADIPALLVGADLLVLPLDFAEKDLAFARYSMPTKVSEYLGSGTPVLLYCPEDTAVADYAARAGWGALVGKRDPDALAHAILRLSRDEELRSKLGTAALAVAAADQDPDRIRADFARALAEAAAARPGLSNLAPRARS
jgi:glycosyltransferase involved in cell wall biosynthesis